MNNNNNVNVWIYILVDGKIVGTFYEGSSMIEILEELNKDPDYLWGFTERELQVKINNKEM